MAQLVKSVNGLAIASVKSVKGLAIASVKNMRGLDNTGGGGDPLLPYNFSESFDGAVSGYDNTWTPTAAGGTIDPDYTGVVIGTGHCLRIVSTGQQNNTWAAFTAASTMYGHMLYRHVSGSGSQDILNLRSNTSARLRVQVNTGGAGLLSVSHGATNVACVTTLTDGVTYHIWFRYTAAPTTNDGTAEIAFSTTTTRPTSGNQYNTTTAGTATSTVDRIYLGDNASETQESLFDDVWLDTAGFPQP